MGSNPTTRSKKLLMESNGIPTPDDCAEAKTARHPTGYVARGFKLKMRILHLVPVYTGKSKVSTIM